MVPTYITFIMQATSFMTGGQEAPPPPPPPPPVVFVIEPEVAAAPGSFEVGTPDGGTVVQQPLPGVPGHDGVEVTDVHVDMNGEDDVTTLDENLAQICLNDPARCVAGVPTARPGYDTGVYQCGMPGNYQMGEVGFNDRQTYLDQGCTITG
jgi:hypothetical protein